MPCPCGRTGHVEAVASGPGLHALYLRSGGDEAVPDARAVVARAQEGDPLAADAVRTAATALGRALGGLSNALDPVVVVVGGGLSLAGDVWWDPLRAAVAAETIPLLGDLTCLPVVLGSDAAVVGAARRAWSLFGEALR